MRRGLRSIGGSRRNRMKPGYGGIENEGIKDL